MWFSRNVTFNQDCFPQAESDSDSGLHDGGDVDSGDDVEEILTGFQDDAAGLGADVVDDSGGDSAVRATAEGPHTEASQTVTLTNSDATNASLLPRRERRPPLRLGDLRMGEELENLALHSEALAELGVPETTEETLGD